MKNALESKEWKGFNNSHVSNFPNMVKLLCLLHGTFIPEEYGSYNS